MVGTWSLYPGLGQHCSPCASSAAGTTSGASIVSAALYSCAGDIAAMFTFYHFLPALKCRGCVTFSAVDLFSCGLRHNGGGDGRMRPLEQNVPLSSVSLF